MSEEQGGHFDLGRFVAAQDGVIDAVRAELGTGLKRSHWMWFVFPQLRALGRSPTAQRYGIADAGEAAAYLAHPVLGPRLVDCTGLVLGHRGRRAIEIFGMPDTLKFRSSMTLFSCVDGAPALFAEAIAAFYDGPDQATLDLLARPA